MNVVAWLLVVQACGILADNVDLTEDKTYRFIVLKGFSVKICGTGSGKPFLCYNGKRNGSTGDSQYEKCLDYTSCLIKAEYRSSKELLVDYGEGGGFFKSECAVVKVEEKIQYGINAARDKNGTCPWKTDAKGMLAVDVTTAVGYTMTILDVTQVPDANESPLPFWVYIVIGVGVLAVLAGFVVGGFFLWQFLKKRKIDGQPVKESKNDGKNDVKAVATEKNPRFEEETANFVGQSREREKEKVGGTKEKVETRKDELSDGKETLKKTSDEPMKDKPAVETEKQDETAEKKKEVDKPVIEKEKQLEKTEKKKEEVDKPAVETEKQVEKVEKKKDEFEKPAVEKEQVEKAEKKDELAVPKVQKKAETVVGDDKMKKQRRMSYGSDHSRVDTDHPKAIDYAEEMEKKERQREKMQKRKKVGDKYESDDEKKKKKQEKPKKAADSDDSRVATDHPKAIDVEEERARERERLRKEYEKPKKAADLDDDNSHDETDNQTETSSKRKKKLKKRKAERVESEYNLAKKKGRPTGSTTPERKPKKKSSSVDTDHPKAIAVEITDYDTPDLNAEKKKMKKETRHDSNEEYGSGGPPEVKETKNQPVPTAAEKKPKKKSSSVDTDHPKAIAIDYSGYDTPDLNAEKVEKKKMKKETRRDSSEEHGPPEVTEKKNEPVQTIPAAKIEQAKKAEDVEKADKNGKHEKSPKKKEEKRGSDQPVKSDNTKVEQKEQSGEIKDGESAGEKTETNSVQNDRQMAVDETQKSCTKKKLEGLRKMAPKPKRQEKLKSQKESAKGTILEFPPNQDYIKSTVYRKGTEDYDEKEIYRMVHHQGTWWLKNGYLTQKELDFMSERYLFQNRRYAHIIEWKLMVAHVDDGAVVAKKLTELADEFLEGLGLPDEGHLFSSSSIYAVRHAKTPGYIWARCFIKENPELMNVKVADVLDKWTINGLAILLFANITLNERAAILRTIKLKTCRLINQFGQQVQDMCFYPLPLLYRVFEIYNDKSKVFPSEYPGMPFMQNPDIILAPPKRDFEVNPPEKRRQYGTKEERDVSEDIYDQARAMGRVMKEYEEILFKELTVEEDSDMSSEEYEKKVQTEKRRSVVARIAKLKRERNEVNEFQGEDEAISKLISNNGPKRKIPRKFRTGADKDKEESKEPPTKDDAVSSLQLEVNAKLAERNEK